MAGITCEHVDLSPASFRGVEFWVENDRGEYGRRIVTHQFPMRDDPYNEDLGEKSRDFNVSGYVAGNGASSQKDAIVSACRARGPAMLILPAEAPFMAVCHSVVVQRSKDRQGYFEVQMRFTADPGQGVMPQAFPMYEGLISGLTGTLVGVISAGFAQQFSTVNVLPFVVASAQARVVAFSSVMLAALDNVGVDDEYVSNAVTTAIRMAQNAARVVRPTSNDPPVENIVSTIGGLFEVLNRYPARDVIEAVVDLATFTENEAESYSGTSRSAQQDYLNAAQFCGTVRKLALVSYARAAAVTAYSSRRDAITMRASLMQAFEREMSVTTDEAVFNILAAARDYAVKTISEQATTIVPVIVVTSSVSMPSIYWSYRLYGDTSRAMDLSDRNAVATPAFMPQEFEAMK